MANRQCGTCLYWESPDHKEGECRLHPPTLHVLPMRTIQGDTIAAVPIVPRTPAEFWCGDWRAKVSLPDLSDQNAQAGFFANTD